jgi:hypothetical protein
MKLKNVLFENSKEFLKVENFLKSAKFRKAKDVINEYKGMKKRIVKLLTIIPCNNDKFNDDVRLEVARWIYYLESIKNIASLCMYLLHIILCISIFITSLFYHIF